MLMVLGLLTDFKTIKSIMYSISFSYTYGMSMKDAYEVKVYSFGEEADGRGVQWSCSLILISIIQRLYFCFISDSRFRGFFVV